MSISCLVLDDDQIYCDLIAEMISERPKLFFSGAYIIPREAILHLGQENIDILFVDMEMPGVSGIDFVKNLKDPPMIIYITSHPEFAINSYEVGAVDYLTKPISEPAFDRAVSKAIKKIEIEKKADIADSMIDVINQDHEYFVIRNDSKYVKIKYKDVVFIEAFADFVKIHTPLETYVHLSNLKSIEAALPQSIFIRTHRSYIVNTRCVESISGSEIKIGDSIIPIGESYKEIVMDRIIGDKLIKR
jgi:two-component system LytT family response regulator